MSQKLALEYYDKAFKYISDLGVETNSKNLHPMIIKTSIFLLKQAIEIYDLTSKNYHSTPPTRYNEALKYLESDNFSLIPE